MKGVYLPVAHAVQKLEPIKMLYVPSGHVAHMGIPAELAYLPAVQFSHCVKPVAPLPKKMFTMTA